MVISIKELIAKFEISKGIERDEIKNQLQAFFDGVYSDNIVNGIALYGTGIHGDDYRSFRDIKDSTEPEQI